MAPTRYKPSAQSRPGSLVLAGGIVALMITGIMFAAPDIGVTILKPPPLVTYPVPVPPPPEPLPPTPPEQRQTAKQTPPPRAVVDQPPVIVTRPAEPPVFGSGDPVVISGPADSGTGTGVAIDPPAPPPPVIVEPVADPRYADDFQPLYPADERRLGREGLVKVRVLVGVDARVRAVEEVSAATPAFFESTRRQALNKWRFRPATRGGVPIERWRVVRVNFLLTDE